MKKMNKLTVAALALVVAGFASTAASAANVSTTPGDLILGFEITDAPNASPTDLEIDLGAASLFNPTATIDLSSKLNVNDLITAFGSGWANNTGGVGVNWGAAANAAGTGANKENLDLTSNATVTPIGKPTNALTGTFNSITALTTGSGGINNSPAASTSSSALIGNSGSPASGIANSWSGIYASNLKGFQGSIETTGAGTDELYQYQGGGNNNGPVVDLGTLSLSSTGALTFTGSAAAVPEPSAYALGICAVLLFIVLRRRHSVA